jgi:hypothetical protein
METTIGSRRSAYHRPAAARLRGGRPIVSPNAAGVFPQWRDYARAAF